MACGTLFSFRCCRECKQFQDCVEACTDKPDRCAYNESRYQQISANEYQQQALRTATDGCFDLINAALGITGEAGEVADVVKKYMYHKHVLDKEKLIYELGDTLWYISLMASILGVTLNEIMEKNIAKLWERYPEGFSPEKSVNRSDGK